MKKIQKVLLLDDSSAINKRNKSLLNSMDFFGEIVSFTKPMKVLKHLEKDYNTTNLDTLPNIIFLDIEMPNMNAFEFLEKYSNIQNVIDSDFSPFIIIVSDHLMVGRNFDNLKRYESIGVADQVKKPIDKIDIVSLIEDYEENLRL